MSCTMTVSFVMVDAKMLEALETKDGSAVTEIKDGTAETMPPG